MVGMYAVYPHRANGVYAVFPAAFYFNSFFHYLLYGITVFTQIQLT